MLHDRLKLGIVGDAKGFHQHPARGFVVFVPERDLAVALDLQCLPRRALGQSLVQLIEHRGFAFRARVALGRLSVLRLTRLLSAALRLALHSIGSGSGKPLLKGVE